MTLSRSSARRGEPRCLPLLIGLCTSLPCLAVDEARLEIPRIDGPGWSLEDVRASLTTALQGESLMIEAAVLHLPQPVGRLENLRIECARAAVDGRAVRCPELRVRAVSALVADDDLRGTLAYHRDTGEWQFEFPRVRLADLEFAISGEVRGDNWRVDASAVNQPAGAVVAALGRFVTLPGPFTVDGSVSFGSQLRGTGGSVARAEAALDVAALTFSDEAGSYASDSLQARVALAAVPVNASTWSLNGSADMQSGQLYVAPIFVDFAEAPLNVALGDIRWSPADGNIEVVGMTVAQRDAFNARLALQTRGAWPLHFDTLSVALNDASVAALYDRYLQPFLIGTGLDALETVGTVAAAVTVRDHALASIAIELTEVGFADQRQRFLWEGVNGQVNWTEAAARAGAEASAVTWNSGSLFRLLFGAGAAHFEAAGDGLSLTEPLRVPILDGAVLVQTLTLGGLFAEQREVHMNAALEPLDLTGLTAMLGWPQFGGVIGGSLPEVTYRDGSLEFAGGLRAEAFDGSIDIRSLRLDGPFDLVSQLTAEAYAENLDLELVTRAFSFGRITGRMHADIRGLRLLNWIPVSFDARFHTPDDVKGKRRISQRAIDNISSIGGGPSGALAQGFLGVFDDFAYERIALGCVLQGNTCRMSGAGAADGGGYYIVKGRSLPRIDVVGYAREVNWPVLMRQLRSATQSGPPTIE